MKLPRSAQPTVRLAHHGRLSSVPTSREDRR